MTCRLFQVSITRKQNFGLIIHQSELRIISDFWYLYSDEGVLVAVWFELRSGRMTMVAKVKPEYKAVRNIWS